jgi:exonuclease III
MPIDKLSINIISQNARGLRAKVKRRACLRPIAIHGDIALIQDTHCDNDLMAKIKTEFPGEWFFSNCTNFNAGVAIGILKLFGIEVVKDSFFSDATG